MVQGFGLGSIRFGILEAINSKPWGLGFGF